MPIISIKADIWLALCEERDEEVCPPYREASYTLMSKARTTANAYHFFIDAGTGVALEHPLFCRALASRIQCYVKYKY